MSYIKNSLPDDWEPEQSYYPKKYLCIGNKEIKAEWLPRWYDVPHEECIFFKNSFGQYPFQGCIILTPLRKGSDYKQKLKELKTERLLDG
jgi:hypothetical protein